MSAGQAIIMAAGLGSRLKNLTKSTPKALIEVGGRPLIDYALLFARRAGAQRRVVVGGFGHKGVAARVAAQAPDAVVVENREFRKGNLISMRTGYAALAPGGFLLMNADHVYPPSIATVVARVCAAAREVTAFCDFDRHLGPKDMKVKLNSIRRVVEMSETLPEWNCGYVGMTYVPAARRADYEAAAARVLKERGAAVHVESILVALAAADAPPEITDVSGRGWLEIDEPHERAHADTVLASERWWT
ncbi:MAG TPA: NTP transferase domain-containing protein [Kofleriaceae bacterium]|nr:NTP transferase domain-containing protein [Kofleriaceae bacterium]